MTLQLQGIALPPFQYHKGGHAHVAVAVVEAALRDVAAQGDVAVAVPQPAEVALAHRRGVLAAVPAVEVAAGVVAALVAFLGCSTQGGSVNKIQYKTRVTY